MNNGNIYNNDKCKQRISKVNFENLKSDYFIKKIFDNLKKNKSLEIMKYNKQLQKRLNLTVNNYEEYSQLFTPIEIELKFVDNKYGNFINIPKKYKEYFHIYFDDSKEEIKRNYLMNNEKVNKIKIIIDFEVKSLKCLFTNCAFISSIYFKKFHRINIANMSYMFYYCLSLKELNISNIHTNNVTDMSYMFYCCSSLKKLNLSNFITNNVIDMKWMFSHCSSLKELNISIFNINNVVDFSNMFLGCSAELKNTIKLQNININI